MTVSVCEVRSLNTPTHWDPYKNPVWLSYRLAYTLTDFWGSVSQPEDRNLIRLQLHGVVYLLTSCTYAQGSDVRQCSWCIHPSAKRSNKHLVKTERPQTPTSKALRSIAAVQCQSGRLDLNHHPRKSNHSAPFWWLYSSIKGCPKCQWKNTEVNYARDRFKNWWLLWN